MFTDKRCCLKQIYKRDKSSVDRSSQPSKLGWHAQYFFRLLQQEPNTNHLPSQTHTAHLLPSDNGWLINLSLLTSILEREQIYTLAKLDRRPSPNFFYKGLIRVSTLQAMSLWTPLYNTGERASLRGAVGMV